MNFQQLSCFSLASVIAIAAMSPAANAGGDATGSDFSFTNARTAAPGSTSTVVFSGIDVTDDSHATYSGVIKSLNRDLSQDGLMLRAVGVYAGFEYDTTGFVGTDVIDGDAVLLDVMLGYQWLRPGARFAVYVGGDYQDYDLTPNDPTNEVNGNEFGFKVAADFETDATSRIYAGILATYSTAFDTYWTRGRLGLRHEGVVFGVEGGFAGNEGYDSQRVGGFVNIDVPVGPLSGQVSISGGYQFLGEDEGPSSSGGEGVYGGLGYSFSF